jgi:hypothetical protein
MTLSHSGSLPRSRIAARTAWEYQCPACVLGLVRFTSLERVGVGVATAGETLDLGGHRLAVTSGDHVDVFATERIRHPSDTRAVTRNAWTLASVCHSSPIGAGAAEASSRLRLAAEAVDARSMGGLVRGSTSPATSYPSAARCRGRCAR